MIRRWKTALCCTLLCCTLALQVNAADSEPVQDAPPVFDPQADEILHSMAAYMKEQKGLRVEAEALLDIVTDDNEIITYTTRVNLAVQRPNKMYARRVGDLRNQEFFYNGSEVVLHSLRFKVYASAKAPGTIGEMLDYSMENLGVQAPGGDLLYKDLYEGMMQQAVASRYLGTTAVNGIECHHLAYRGNEVDFQLWVETGDKPRPRRYMIISKLMPSAPRYILTINSMEPEVFSDDMFTFTPSPEDKKIRFLTAGEIEKLKQAVKEAP
jgi:hypothetical protein